ncbi:glycosyltransferase family 2 protein [Acidianus sp. RZ1]|uniref:glycosyltransferase n=1 Tax=Acidianus sp. RZ1 TaxID=1540082 RepID=UPI001492449F|nr:glycosyltransferase [Acidianus sp. RZ1]NON63040.1 glycosyltransferase [Acidianus sp. RZ1]
MLEDPLVSLVIPTLNSGKTVRKTLESIKNLDYTNFEIIVVDGNSTDDTLDIVREYSSSYPLRVVVEEKKGRGPAYNRGIIESKGKYVAFLDSDAMIATPGWIRRAINIMQNDDKIAVVFTKVYSPPDSSLMQKSIDTFLCKGYTTANGAIYRRDIVEKVGMFNDRMNYMQEDELLFKLTKEGYKFAVNYNDKIYHYHRNTFTAYIKQNAEAAKGAKDYAKFVGNRKFLFVSELRVASFIISIGILIALLLFSPLLVPILIAISYLALVLKVNKETCSIYRNSKYVILAPFMIYLSLAGFTVGFLTT